MASLLPSPSYLILCFNHLANPIPSVDGTQGFNTQSAHAQYPEHLARVLLVLLTVSTYLFKTTSNYVIETLKGRHTVNKILTININIDKLSIFDTDSQLQRLFGFSKHKRHKARSVDDCESGRHEPQLMSADSEETLCDGNNHYEPYPSKNAPTSHSHRPSASASSSFRNMKATRISSCSAGGSAVPLVAVANKPDAKSQLRLRCPLWLSPVGCTVCRTHGPTDFPNLSHMWGHIYRCKIVCSCDLEHLTYKSVKQHLEQNRGHCLIIDPTNKWPYGVPPTIELLTRIAAAQPTSRSAACEWPLPTDDGKRWVENWCDIVEYYSGYSNGQIWPLMPIPNPYTTPSDTQMIRTGIQSHPQQRPPVDSSSFTTEQVSMVPMFRQPFNGLQSRPRDLLQAPGMTSSHSFTSNISSTADSHLSTGSSAPYLTVTPSTHLRPPNTIGADSFSSAPSSMNQFRDTDLDFCLRGDTHAGTQMSQDVEFVSPTHLAELSNTTTFVGLNEGVSDINMQRYGPAAPDAGFDGFDEGNQSQLLESNAILQPGLNRLPDGSLVYVDPDTNESRPLGQLSKNQYIAIIKDLCGQT